RGRRDRQLREPEGHAARLRRAFLRATPGDAAAALLFPLHRAVRRGGYRVRVLPRGGVPGVQADRLARDLGLRNDSSKRTCRRGYRQRVLAGLRVRDGHRAPRHAALRRRRYAAVLRKRSAVLETISVKITFSWLKEFTPLTVTPAQLAEQLTLSGLEVESLTPVAAPFSG